MADSDHSGPIEQPMQTAKTMKPMQKMHYAAYKPMQKLPPPESTGPKPLPGEVPEESTGPTQSAGGGN